LQGAIPGDWGKPFHILLGGEQQQPSSDIFAMPWGTRHEINGVTSLLESFDEISASIVTKPNYSVLMNGLLLYKKCILMSKAHCFAT